MNSTCARWREPYLVATHWFIGAAALDILLCCVFMLSVGVALYPVADCDLDALLERAGIAVRGAPAPHEPPGLDHLHSLSRRPP